uniref:Uncharacterized protein n=1 Tax=Anguilla anguilla TaxID=7936 RepID=A0A0E9TTL7_ANGAN
MGKILASSSCHEGSLFSHARFRGDPFSSCSNCKGRSERVGLTLSFCALGVCLFCCSWSVFFL